MEEEAIILISAARVPIKRFDRSQVTEMFRTNNDLFFPLFPGWYDKGEYKKFHKRALTCAETGQKYILHY